MDHTHTRSAFTLACQGARQTARYPGLWAALLAVHYLVVAAVTGIGAYMLPPSLTQHLPDAFSWAVLFRHTPQILRTLVCHWGAAFALYGISAAWCNAGSIATIANRRWTSVLGRPALRLLILRILVVVAIGMVAAGWMISAQTFWQFGLSLNNEHLMIATQAMPLALALVVVALLSALLHYAQIAVVTCNVGPLAALRLTLKALSSQPRLFLTLWLIKWSVWIVISVIALTSLVSCAPTWFAALIPQIGVALKIGTSIWGWITGHAVVADTKCLTCRELPLSTTISEH